jgi:hypothetical protein
MVAIVPPNGYTTNAPNLFSVGARLPSVSMGGSSADAGSRCQNGESACHEYISDGTLAMMIQISVLPSRHHKAHLYCSNKSFSSNSRQAVFVPL